MKCSSRFGILAGSLLSLPLMTTAAHAGQDSAPVDVKANVVAACSLVTPPPAEIDFGGVTAGGGGVNTGVFTATVNCTQGINFEWGFDGGQQPSGVGQPQMFLTGGDPNLPEDFLPYDMVSPGDDAPIGDTGGALISAGTNAGLVEMGIGGGVNQSLEFYGSTFPQATQSVGPYADVITFLFAF